MTETPKVSRNDEVLIISPHRDDAAFSCGVLIQALLARDREVTIANIFTKSDYAPYLPATAYDRVDEVSLARASEDANFISVATRTAETTESKLRSVDLGWEDAPLRRSIPAEEVLLAPICAKEQSALTEQVRKLANGAVAILVPQGLGNHMDHLLAREASIGAFPSNKLLYYEDLPYACRLGPHQDQPNDARRTWLSPVAASGTKRAYALCYPSQIAPDVADEMEIYAASLGGRERFRAAPGAINAIESLLSI